jgi:hypothetical protein
MLHMGVALAYIMFTGCFRNVESNVYSMKMVTFWDIAPCAVVEVERLSEVRTASIIMAFKLTTGCPATEEPFNVQPVFLS